MTIETTQTHFIFLSSTIIFWFSIIWPNKNWYNAFIKFVLLVVGLWGTLIGLKMIGWI